MADDVFEAAFSELAHAACRDEAPSLQKYMVGFQIVEKNDDETHALGVFGFKVGDQWFFAPVFYMAGAIKGTELMFVHGQKLFVPLDDGWVSYYLSKRPQIVGGAEYRDEQFQGVAAPSFEVFHDSPSGQGKFASFKEACDKLATHMYDLPDGAPDASLTGFVSRHPEAAIKIAEACMRVPPLQEAIETFYNMDEILTPANAKAAAEKCKKKTTLAKGKTKKAADEVAIIIDGIDHPAANTLTNLQKEQVAQGDPVVLDTRKLTSSAYKVDEQEDFSAAEIAESGYYKVLLKDGGTKDCYVDLAPGSFGGYANGTLVLGSDGAVEIAGRAGVFGMGASDTKFVDKAPTVKSMNKGKCYMLFDGARMYGPMLAVGRLSTSGGAESILVKPINLHNASGRSLPAYGTSKGGYALNDYEPEPEIVHECGLYAIPETTPGPASEGLVQLVLAPKHSRIKYTATSTAYIPTATKAIELKVNAVKKRDWVDHEFEPIRPGGLDVIDNLLLKAGSAVDNMHVFRDGPHYVIRGDSSRQVLNKKAAFSHLILDWGFRKEAAEKILNEATGQTTSYYVIKKAVRLPSMEPNRSYDPALGIDVETPIEETIEIDAPSGGELLDDQDVQRIMEAAQEGEKDIFNVASIKSLADAIDVGELIDSYLPDMIRTMDRFGRLLFHLYWKPDQIAERYGREDMKELEDAFRNNFSALGEAILYLRQKTVSVDPIGSRLELSPEV